MTYQRRADYPDLPLPAKLGILQHELSIAETDEQRRNALAAIEHLKFTIERFTPKPATHKQFEDTGR